MRQALPRGTPDRLGEANGGRRFSSLYGTTESTYVQRAETGCQLDASVRAPKAGRRRPPTREREQDWATRRRGGAVPMHGLPTTTSCSRSAAQ